MREPLLEYKCPQCQGSLRWSMSNSEAGASTTLICANAAASTRISFNIKDEPVFCFWEGLAIRQKDGSIKYFYEDGITPLRTFNRYK